MIIGKLVYRLPLYLDLLKARLSNNSKHRLPYKKEHCGIINILGTGPSLKDCIGTIKSEENSSDCFAVNDFSLSDLYEELQPKYYIFLDPVYFLQQKSITQKDYENRNKVFSRIIEATKWNMQIFVPSKWYSIIDTLLTDNRNTSITITPVNFSELSLIDCKAYYKALYRNTAASFFNVLGAAMYVSINLGYDEIRVFGAEHSWTKDLRVNDRNQVCTVYRHFYDEEEELVPWVNFNKKPFSMELILSSLHKTFKGYELLAKYAEMHSCKIFNYTPGSFIDAFERRELKK